MSVAEIVEGALLGAPVGELLKFIIDVASKSIEFKSILMRLQFTLSSLESNFYEIEELSIEKEATEKFLDLLKDGKELVCNCSESNILTYAVYANKLLELEASLLRFFQINVQAQLWKESKKLSKGMKELEQKFDQILLNGGGGGVSGAIVLQGTFDRVMNNCSGGGRLICGSSDDCFIATTEPVDNGLSRRITTSWVKGNLLGSGSLATVYEAITDDGFFFAVKEVSLPCQGNLGYQSQLEQEISLLSQFHHENIVQYFGADKCDGKLRIYVELITKGSVSSLYQKYYLKDSQVSAYSRQILNGLNYLHERNVVHGDIKCANILVDASGSVKLSDFGLIKVTKLNDIIDCKGTPFWTAPEVVNNQNHKSYGRAADIWSLGCTVLEMLTGRIPYSPLEVMQALCSISRGVPPPIPKRLSRDAQNFIRKCLQVNPDDRPTAAYLLDHPFVKRRRLPLSSTVAYGPNSYQQIEEPSAVGKRMVFLDFLSGHLSLCCYTDADHLQLNVGDCMMQSLTNTP